MPMAPCSQDITSVDLRMKLAILAVCKSWNRVGTELLYESVALRRITQLPVLARALEGREELRSLVKSVRINCLAPRGYSKLHEHETKRILGLCPNIVHVGFSPPFWIPGLPHSLPTTIDFGSITSLEYNQHIPYSAILPSLVRLSQTLKSLALPVPAVYDAAHPVLEFPKLEDLCVTLTPKSVVSADKWRARPRRLWVYERPHERERPHLGIKQLLDAYGPTITYLRIHTVDQELLDRCPLLEHIAVDCALAAFTHQRVRFIDTFTSCKDPPFPSVKLPDGAFPALVRCRNFDTVMSQFRYVPRRGQGAEDAVATFLEFTDETSVYGEAAFVRKDTSEDYVPNSDEDDGSYSDDGSGEDDGEDEDDSGEDADDDSEGPEHVTDSDEDDGGSDSSSDAASCITVSEDGDCLRDEFYMQEYWEVGREEALVIFERTHD
ncbi:hypothetical protein B0H12DRAFT_1129499, partial [Mycena haematopus]